MLPVKSKFTIATYKEITKKKFVSKVKKNKVSISYC